MPSMQKIYIFINGAFRTSSYWNEIVSKLRTRGNADFIMSSLPFHDPVNHAKHVLLQVNKVTRGSNVELIIVGHSLGAVQACFIANEASCLFNVKLFIMSPPLINSKIKSIIYLLWVALLLPFRVIPMSVVPKCFLGIRLQGIPCPGILALWRSDIYGVLNKNMNRLISINIGFGSFDIISAIGVNELVRIVSGMGYPVSRKRFRLSGHHPPITQRMDVVRWIS